MRPVIRRRMSRFVKGTGRFREVGGASEGELALVLQYYQSLSPARLVVVGDPGAEDPSLPWSCLSGSWSGVSRTTVRPLPVLISASAYDARLSWEKWLAAHVAQRFGMSTQVAARLVRDGRVLPVVDGLDEMDPPGDQQRVRVLVTALNSSMRGRDRAAVVVTCRTREVPGPREER